MKMLITGSSGFIGRTLVKNIEGIPCDISSSDTKPNCDVTNVDDIINSSKDCDGIIHLAALSRVADCESEPQICIDININGTKKVLDAAIIAGINKIVFASSSEVYGEPLNHRFSASDTAPLPSRRSTSSAAIRTSRFKRRGAL